MIDKVTSQANISSMLQTLRAYQADAAGGMNTPSVDKDKSAQKTGFGDMIRQTIENVNSTQQTANDLEGAYMRGESVPLTDVVMAMQKSSLSFEATLQVRNKVLKAYEDILNMPV
jgi:flagellar hook-basal body complex protein FliE